MNPKISDLIAALPAEESRTSQHDAALREILAELAGKPVPVGAFQRLWTVGGLSAEVTCAYLALWMRQWFADADTRQKNAMETNLRVGLKLVRRLGYLRGAMTKVGQALGSFPEILPDELVDVLDRLHFDAPPMHYSLVAEMLENELGGAPDDVFASFDREPIAAASLGQVHRARLHTGEDVAVKIQYPGIARAIEADFRNLTALLLPLRLGSQWESLKGYVEEIRRMTTLEANYRHEAENLLRARELFSMEDGIVVPALHPGYSTERILTTDFLPGSNLGEFLSSDPPEEARDAFGMRIYRVEIRMAFAHMSYVDPHSGNYIFMKDGRLGLVDFGCVQNFDEEERELMKLSEQLIDNSPDTIRNFLKRACSFDEKDLANDDYVAAMERSLDWFSDLFRGPQPFDFGDPRRLRSGVENHAYLVRRRYTKSHPMFVYQMRSGYGLAAVLYRLKARVDMYELGREELEERDRREGGRSPSPVSH
jgi:predicted unusual protein kinase regulating ubiquinone biosynthesis (AarF/ABC1/UbiB family)